MLDFFTESDWGIHFIILIKITSYSLFLKMNCLHVLEQQSWYHPNYVVCSDLELLHFKIEQNTKIFLNERWFTRLIHNRYSIGRRFCGPSSFIPFPSLFMWNNPILTFWRSPDSATSEWGFCEYSVFSSSGPQASTEVLSRYHKCHRFGMCWVRS